MRELYIKRAIIASWLIMALLIFFSSMKEQVVLNGNVKLVISTLFPEGWGFFTKNPREEFLELYRMENGKPISVIILNQSIENIFGLSRKSRLVGYEASMLAKDIPVNKWISNERKPIEAFANLKSSYTKPKGNFRELVNGEYLLKVTKPVPFAWAKRNQEAHTPFKVIKVRIADEE